MSADNYQTLPLQQKLNQHATNRAIQAIEETGRALPCTVTAVDGSLVTVAFEVNSPWTLPPLTLPKAESQWLRSPTQIGDVGLTVPADTFLGGISGLGNGVADLGTNYGNLSTLIWIPVAALGFTANPNPNSAWVNGPAGALVSDTARTVYTLYDASGKAVSIVVPTAAAGGLLGLGAIASTLGASRAVSAQADLQTLANNIVAQTMQTFTNQLLAVFVAQGVPNSALVQAIVTASNWVKNLPGINPTIPACSSIVRVTT